MDGRGCLRMKHSTKKDLKQVLFDLQDSGFLILKAV